MQYVWVQIIDNGQIIVPDFPNSKYILEMTFRQLGVVVHTFNPSSLEAETGDLCEPKASLVCRVRFCLQTSKQN